MSYTTIMDLPERLQADVQGTEYFLISDPDYSYKVSVNTINQVLLDATSNSYMELTNKVIDNVTNYVHANAIHFVAKPIQNIDKGTPVKLVSDIDDEFVYVDIAGANDVAVGICEDGMVVGELGEVMVSGILNDIDTTGFAEGDLLYAIDGALTNVQPANDKIQFVGYVLNSAVSGKILVSGTDPYPDARQVLFDNTTSDLTASTVQGAFEEVDTRVTVVEDAVTDLQEIVFQQATAPTIAQGASDGDIWMDTTTNTLKVYREYPLGTGVYRWEPLLYKWDDVVDGGSW